MHETLFARKIIEEAKKQGDVKGITLEIGELAPVPPEELLECLRELVEWDIESTIIPAKVECVCGYRGPPVILERGHDSFFIECPTCKNIPELIDGQDITLVDVLLK